MIKQVLLGTTLAAGLAAPTTAVYAQAPKEAAMNSFVSALMKKMTLDEKIGQLNLLTPGGGILTGAVVNPDVESKIKAGNVGGLFGVIGVEKIRQAQELAVNGSRLKIPLIFGSDVIHGYKTTFPIPLALACSWDMPMIERSARVAATEATADGLSWAFSPMVDIARDPRWGRVAEGSGEDPYLGSQAAAAMVRGYQGKDLSADNTLMACVKHFALYGGAEAGRDYNSVDMSMQKMYEFYLPPYKAAVAAGVGSVMSSFNDVNGVPATGNRWLLTDLLRRQWGFKGFVVSDYTSLNEMIAHGMGDLQAVSALALKAGLDMDMVGEGFLTTIKKSLSEKKLTVADVDLACRRILEAKYKLGLFTDPYRYCNPQRAAKEVLSADKRAAAREFAQRSMVLLKNNSNTLPLKRGATIALVGALANNKSNMLGTWAVSGDAQLSVPILEGMKSVAGTGTTILYARGANITDDSSLAKKANVFGEKVDVDPRGPQALLDEAVATAGRADVVVAVVGEASEMSGEAASRSDITIPQSQRNLLEALKRTGKPLVIVVMSGRPLALPWEAENGDALLQAWFGGHETGNALADVLFGNYNPSGKLTMTFPRSVGQVPIYYNLKMTGRPQPTQEFQKFTSNYLDVANTPLFAFGHGLSYTTFGYSDIRLTGNTMTQSGTIGASVTVTNTGDRDGEEVVQLYIRDMVASVTQPVKKLKDFRKIFLKKGESKEVTFEISVEDLRFWNNDLKWVAEPGDFKLFIGTSSDQVKEAGFTLTK
ncbi:MAG: beta-glucosidase BglX [Chitinophagaceae bacterium]|nr:MAG: beta-glucosidase BglX [Chitinophagaceae bacterium]